MEFEIIKNPRKENGDLGDIQCSFCGCHTSVYLFINHGQTICIGCLDGHIDQMKKSILP
jgi:hypothetical protein